MKQKTNRDLSAFTRIELVLLIGIIAVFATLGAMLLSHRPLQHSGDRISCAPNLKEIGMAYRLWAADNGNRNPYNQTVAKGGWADLLTNADQGAMGWTNYVIMQNELGGMRDSSFAPKTNEPPPPI
jgi:hypothetical protein